MQDVLIVSYLVSKEFDLLSRSIFDHTDDCCEDCAGNATAAHRYPGLVVCCTAPLPK
jgi:hypothetical protein